MIDVTAVVSVAVVADNSPAAVASAVVVVTTRVHNGVSSAAISASISVATDVAATFLSIQVACYVPAFKTMVAAVIVKKVFKQCLMNGNNVLHNV